ncbi:MAG TPA: leucine--tRNA ligase [Bacteroidales bacterium]|nr:leucine--tRNA ligase [Bacteroidales bacterium]HRX95901.1 leucine--tRNA ligase [Bacteroidales bacterium]
MEYNHREIEKKWQQYWAENKTYKTEVDHDKPKYYVLDMFPYPSGAGLHVGHPLGYIASDIFSRYKRLKGFNVLHPMGYDAYGLPAEQYAIQTGTHPAITTEKNIARYREQMDKIGFSYDWDREVRTSDPHYYKWTQWTFIQLFRHWYNLETNKAEPIEDLTAVFESDGNAGIKAVSGEVDTFSSENWKQMSEVERQEILVNYRLAYLADTWVNWCPELGTVLANDEVVNGVSERGGHPVERKLMRQWSLRITAYAQRLLDGLNKVDWFESLKEMQRYWIGRSEGAAVYFGVKGFDDQLEVFTTRPDTLWGATFMVLAPEHDIIKKIATSDRREAVEKYVTWAKNRSEVERMSEVKKVTGEFTGAYGINPVSGEEIPIWVADYVLAGYGTGAIMAVPAHDSRDFAFARHFDIPIKQVVAKAGEESDPAAWDESYDAKEGTMINSGFINGMDVKEAIRKTIDYLEDKNLGFGQVNFKLRDAIFSRQRYWGEPFPIYYKDGMPYPLDESELPLELPEVDKYLPTESGEPPLARAQNWHTKEGYPLETNTMPGFAGSSGYYLRYMDPWNKDRYFSKEANEYWRDVDLYLGGDEHATGHLIYSRFWNMFLYDLGLVCEEEPFKKLINQGKIQGRSNFVYRIDGSNQFVSKNLRKEYKTTPIHVDVNMVDNDELDIVAFRQWRPEYASAEFILENGKYICGWEVEKMSKSKHNVVNPDELIDHYGADTFRLYEMFLGPLETHKPWDTKGIEGVYRFMKKLWRLFYDENSNFIVTDEKPVPAELKVLHQTIKKIQDDIERLSLNTAVSQFMICVNELHDLNCHKKVILEPLVILISSYAPHMAEELWHKLGHDSSVNFAAFPEFIEDYVKESAFEYPVSFNGKMRFKLELPVEMGKDEVEKAALADERSEKWIEGKQVRKVIVVPKKIINIVVS